MNSLLNFKSIFVRAETHNRSPHAPTQTKLITQTNNYKTIYVSYKTPFLLHENSQNFKMRNIETV